MTFFREAVGAGFKPALFRLTPLARYFLGHPPTALDYLRCEGVQINAMVMRRKVFPCLLDDRARFIQSHIAVDNFTEQHDALLRGGRDEICAGLRIIVA